MNDSGWSRVTRDTTCKICGKPDWCGFSRDGRVACCMRIESPKRLVNGGYLHFLASEPSELPRRRSAILRTAPSNHAIWARLASRLEQALSQEARSIVALKLGVSSDSLERLRVGWDGQAWTFPMLDPAGNVLGIRRRFPNGEKLSVKGGHDGLFIPRDLKTCGLLLIAEGATDTAALLTLGFEAIGRPSCSGGVRLCIELARTREVALVTDRDWPGRNGAHRLAIVLRRYCASVRVIQPPEGIKDARAWLKAGATHRDVQQAIDAARPLELTIKTNGGSAKPAAKGKLICHLKSYSTMCRTATTAR